MPESHGAVDFRAGGEEMRRGVLADIAEMRRRCGTGWCEWNDGEVLAMLDELREGIEALPAGIECDMRPAPVAWGPPPTHEQIAAHEGGRGWWMCRCKDGGRLLVGRYVRRDWGRGEVLWDAEDKKVVAATDEWEWRPVDADGLPCALGEPSP